MRSVGIKWFLFLGLWAFREQDEDIEMRISHGIASSAELRTLYIGELSDLYYCANWNSGFVIVVLLVLVVHCVEADSGIVVLKWRGGVGRSYPQHEGAVYMTSSYLCIYYPEISSEESRDELY